MSLADVVIYGLIYMVPIAPIAVFGIVYNFSSPRSPWCSAR
jgi:hypothetical protein